MSPAPQLNIGVDVSAAINSTEAINMAGLNWEVGAYDTYYRGGTDEDLTLVKSKKYRSIVRKDTGEEFGHPTKRYTPVQNADAFKWLDDLTDEGVTFWRAGSFRGGRKVFMIVSLPSPIHVNGDFVERSMIVSTSHDSTSGVRANWLPIRIACANVISLALATAPLAFRHTQAVTEGIESERTREMFLNADKYFTKYQETLSQLSEASFSDNDMLDLVETVFEAPRRTERGARRSNDYLYDTLLQMFRNGRETYGSTKWDAFNAICEYVDYARPIGNTLETATSDDPLIVNERHFNSVLSTNRFGGIKLRNKAFEALTEQEAVYA